MIGEGKYDEAAMRARLECQAAGVILIVHAGHSGSGFSAQLSPEMTAAMPAVLRHVADQIEADARRLEPNGGNLYRPHSLMVNPGQFWRCKHGVTGFGEDAEWQGCPECAKDDPEAFAEWHKGHPE